MWSVAAGQISSEITEMILLFLLYLTVSFHPLIFSTFSSTLLAVGSELPQFRASGLSSLAISANNSVFKKWHLFCNLTFASCGYHYAS